VEENKALSEIGRRWKEIGYKPFENYEQSYADRVYWRYLWAERDKETERRAKRKDHLVKFFRPPPPPKPVSLRYGSNRLTLDEALERLERVRTKANGMGWTALCPAHEDRTPSLLVSESNTNPGEPFFYCSAGCDFRAIKNALTSTPN
jgi:hypothetical protein